MDNILPRATVAPVDVGLTVSQNARLPLNRGNSFDRLNSKADSRRARHFLRPSCTIGTPSMPGCGVGYLRVCRFLTAGLSTHAMRPAPSFDSDEPSLTLSKEATMPSSRIITRAIRATIPVSVTRHLAFNLNRRDAISASTLVRTLSEVAA